MGYLSDFSDDDMYVSYIDGNESTDSDDFDNEGYPFGVKLDIFNNLVTFWRYRYNKVLTELLKKFAK